MKRTVFCAALLLAAGCSSPKKNRTVDPLRVETIVAAPSADVGAAVYVGAIEEESSAALSFPVAGTVARTFADEGRRVGKGHLLAELDPTSARRTFEAAEAALNQAKDACARLKQLYDAESLPEIKWVEAQTRLRQAEAAFGIAKKNLEDCSLYAPFSGVVGQRRISAGETALPGVPVLTLLEVGRVKVRFSVPEQEIARLEEIVALLEKGDTTRAIEVLDTGIRKIPFSQIRHNYLSTVPIIEAYYMAGAFDKGNEVLEEYAKNLEENITYYLRFTGKYKDLTLRDVKENAEYLYDLYQIAGMFGQTGQARQIEQYLIDRKRQPLRPSTRTTGRYSNKPTDRRGRC